MRYLFSGAFCNQWQSLKCSVPLKTDKSSLENISLKKRLFNKNRQVQFGKYQLKKCFVPLKNTSLVWSISPKKCLFHKKDKFSYENISLKMFVDVPQKTDKFSLENIS
jgi:hypothetical protein